MERNHLNFPKLASGPLWFGFIFLLLVAGTGLFNPAHSQDRTKIDASVRINKILQAPETRSDSGTVTMEIEILSEPFAGQIRKHSVHQWGHYWYDLNLREGNVFTAQLLVSGDQIQRVILEQERTDWQLLIIFIVVTLVLVAVGRWEGLVGLISTIFSLGLIYFFFFPITLYQPTILLVGLVICVLTIFITISLVMKFDRPTWPAIGSLLVVLGLITVATVYGLEWLQLDSSDAHYSRILITHIHRTEGISTANLWQLITVGIVLSTLGAIMDVAVVISSTIDEITRDLENPTFFKAFESGMNVGQEILSTMINTLIFAYMGIFIPYFLAVEMFELPWIYLLNIDFVGIELLRVAIAQLSMALIVPITSAFAAAWSTTGGARS